MEGRQKEKGRERLLAPYTNLSWRRCMQRLSRCRQRRGKLRRYCMQ
jgi:hypothetical protein